MTKIEFNPTFPHEYTIEEVRDLPSGTSRLKHYFFPEGSEEGGNDGLLFKITPILEEEWLCTFAFGDFPKAVTGIYSCPNEKSVCIISAGIGCIIRTDNPTKWEEIRAYPILDIHLIPTKQLLVFADFTCIIAYGRDGLKWKTKRLSSDELRITEINNDYIKGLGWDAVQNKDVEFSVNIETGFSNL